MLNMNEIYQAFNAETDYEKCVVNELVWLIFEENDTGATLDNKAEVRKAIYGEFYGTLEEKILDVAGYWSNDLEANYKEVKGLGDRKLFDELFVLLEDKEIIEGVCYKKH